MAEYVVLFTDAKGHGYEYYRGNSYKDANDEYGKTGQTLSSPSQKVELYERLKCETGGKE